MDTTRDPLGRSVKTEKRDHKGWGGLDSNLVSPTADLRAPAASTYTAGPFPSSSGCSSTIRNYRPCRLLLIDGSSWGSRPRKGGASMPQTQEPHCTPNLLSPTRAQHPSKNADILKRHVCSSL